MILNAPLTISWPELIFPSAPPSSFFLPLYLFSVSHSCSRSLNPSFLLTLHIFQPIITISYFFYYLFPSFPWPILSIFFLSQSILGQIVFGNNLASSDLMVWEQNKQFPAKVNSKKWCYITAQHFCSVLFNICGTAEWNCIVFCGKPQTVEAPNEFKPNTKNDL